jgi:alpha-L-fucosidase
MKKTKTLVLIGVLFLVNLVSAQGKKYEPNWKSLDSRPVAQWFKNAKFGIFIHWGPYSVPAWSPKGTYSEWYQYWMQNKKLFGNGKFTGTEVYDYHVKTFGKDFSYYQFGDMFSNDLFDPDDWAKLFVKSGAKYVVTTSKHHDGYCLWPSKEANDRGFPWNSAEVGAKRDILDELTKAMRKTDVKVGFYYSLYEWFHPWWLEDKERFVDEHFFPQFKDLIERYQPDIIWGDGEWSMPAEKWKTPELLAWLFNESSVKDNIVINDRWGKGVRQKHGGYYTTEYEAGASYEHPWEECRGMGYSFGYNRNEDAEDYNSPQTLILMLIDIVSNGGNLLLDIGPDARGRIPVIMQERLLQIGKWLETSGEAIYGTRQWKKSVQWSAGDRNYEPKDKHYLGGDYILKQTIDPDSGYAVKEIFFTYKNRNLYAIIPRWPGKKLVIKDFQAKTSSQIFFLATGRSLNWKNEDGNLVVDLPEFDPNELKPEEMYAYVFKITDIDDYTSNHSK